ncbi:nitrate- and nitrite sensing domain-containing protein [Streptosporangium sp. NPDC048047]|uniref:sensor histidine kinase n=1 Tax=Streptosporangium sp. NPDC048047 TaxID=3155748 RepID=UPI0034342F5F
MASQTIRFKLYSLLSLPIVALIALWTFVTGHVVGDFFTLREATTLYEQISEPATELVIRVQNERRFSAIVLSTATPRPGTLTDVRRRTDKAVTDFRLRATSQEAAAVTTPELAAAIDRVVTETEKLRSVRRDVDAGASDRLEAVQAFSRVVDAAYRLQDKLVTISEVELYRQAVGLQRIAHARDLISREDALVSGAIRTGTLAHDEYEAIEAFAPNRRLLLVEGTSTLDDELRAPFQTLLDSAVHRRLTGLEDEIVDTSRLPKDSGAWPSSVTAVGDELDRLVITQSGALNERADDAAGGIILRIVLAGGLGLAAIIGAVVLSARLGRGLAAELGGLRRAAVELAEVRLPRVVERLRAGESVDVEADAPAISTGGTTVEIVDVGRAFASVQRTAVESAVAEAKLRHGFNRVFRNLARRTQSLVHRQLSQLDAMQRKATRPETLDDLYRLDHLTTRMRRQAEGLVILSGATVGRSWRHPVSFVDVVRGAVAEVEEYRRIEVQPMPDVRLAGSATADVTHLLAELLENATVFSPPTTRVDVRGEAVGWGFAIEIEDRGLGLPAHEITEINERLSHPPRFDTVDGEQLGLFVVGHLAARHGIRVTLSRSPFGGTVAIVLIPQSMLAGPEAGPGAADSEAGPEEAGSPTAVPAENTPGTATRGEVTAAPVAE